MLTVVVAKRRYPLRQLARGRVLGDITCSKNDRVPTLGRPNQSCFGYSKLLWLFEQVPMGSEVNRAVFRWSRGHAAYELTADAG
jgi:hypothetical protein